MLKLAFRNITSKPWRFVATILAIAVVVAMSFSMLSYRSAVYDYLYAIEMSFPGKSDITITINSSSNRITEISSSLESLDGVEEIVPVLNLYAMFGDEYVSVRGYEKNQFECLQTIDLKSGSVSDNIDDIIISTEAAEHYNLKVGDCVNLTLGQSSVQFFVSGIAQKSGYFLSDSPFLVVGRLEQVTKLAIGANVPGNPKLFNCIYVCLKDGVDIAETIATISSMEEYSDMFVTASENSAYIDEQTDSIAAPVVLAGIAVLLLGIAIIVLLYGMSEGEKRTLISRLSVVGATKRQVFAIFLIESVLQAGIGAIFGSVIAVGVFMGLLKFALSSTITFSLSVWYLLVAGIIGFVSAIISSLMPINKAFKVSIRENQLDVDKQKRQRWILPICAILLTFVALMISAFVDEVAGIFGLIGTLLALVALAVCSAPVLKMIAGAASKTSNPSVKTACLSIAREKRFSRSSVLLTSGMAIAMMLFMAWSLTTTIFTAYVSEFEHMVLVKNIRSEIQESEFSDVEGIYGASKMMWAKGDVLVEDNTVTMNIFGSKSMLDILDFEYITPKERVDELISTDKPYVFVDISLEKLYGIKEGDVIEIAIDKVKKEVVVGGILKHNLFSGRYVIMSKEVAQIHFGQESDTVLAVVNSDYSVDGAVKNMREKFAGSNYYVVSALESFKWDLENMYAVFDLIGALAIAVLLFICGVSITSAVIGRATANGSRVAMLNAGMSKNTLLKSEVFEYALTALTSFCLALLSSLVLADGLIYSLRLFGLFFDYLYEAWVTASVGGAMALCYTLTPLVFNFKKGYNLKKV